MSATQATVTSTQVAVRYRRNVGSLSIDMSADCRTTTLGRHIDRRVNRDIGRYLDRYVGRHVDRHIGRGVLKIHMILFRHGLRLWNSENKPKESSSEETCIHAIFNNYSMRAR